MTENDKDKLLKLKAFRLPEELVNKFELTAQEKKKSEQEFAEEVFRRGLEAQADQGHKLIYKQLIFKGRCKKCGKEVAPAEWAFWGGPGSGLIICTDCEARKFGTKSEAQKALLIAQLEYRRTALKFEITRLIEKFGKYNAYEVLDKLYTTNEAHKTQVNNVLATVKDYMSHGFATGDEEKQLLQKLLDNIEQDQQTNKQVLEAIAEIRDFLTNPFIKKKKRQPSTADQDEQTQEIIIPQESEEN